MNCITFSNSSEISGALRHSMRENSNYKNRDIDSRRTKENYQVGEHRANPFEHYKERLNEVYCYNRSDVKTLCCWTVTAPRDTPPEQEKKFFNAAYDFLTEKFCSGNTDNVCLAIIHRDEKRIDGRPRAHMHYYFLPIAPDPKHKQGEKICKKEVMPRSTFKTIHPDFQKYLQQRGIAGTVNSGITGRQVRNYSVEEIKSGVRDRVEAQHREQQAENFFSQSEEQQRDQDQTSWFDQDQEQEVTTYER